VALLEEELSPFPELVRSDPLVHVLAEHGLALLIDEVSVPPLECEAVLLRYEDVWYTRLDLEYLPPDEWYLLYLVVVSDVLALPRDEQGVLVVWVLVVAPVGSLLRLKDGVEAPILVESYPGTYWREGAPFLCFYEFCFPPVAYCVRVLFLYMRFLDTEYS
jgi:hypothetical protein